MPDVLSRGIVAHLIADWLLQNEWMAVNKVSLRHPAAWVHMLIHAGALLFVFSVAIAIPLALIHMLIDTRKPLQWWRQRFGQTTEVPMASHVAIWTDQAAHIACIAAACCWRS